MEMLEPKGKLDTSVNGPERAVRGLMSLSSLGLEEAGWSGVRCWAMGVAG